MIWELLEQPFLFAASCTAKLIFAIFVFLTRPNPNEFRAGADDQRRGSGRNNRSVMPRY